MLQAQQVALTFDDLPHASISDLPNRLLTTDPNIPFASRSAGSSPDDRVVDARTGGLISGGATIPLDLMPDMIVFTDASNPHSAHVFDPRNPERWLGPGVKFLGARIEVTKEPVGSDISSVLPWLDPPELDAPHPYIQALDGSVTTKDDPIATETHGHFLLYRGDF